MTGGRIAAAGLAACWCGAAAAAQAPASEAAAVRGALDAVLAPFLAEADLAPAARIETLAGAVVYDRRGEEAFVLASNIKVFTTAAALLALGPEHRWTTGALVADGALWILAGADPSLRKLADRAADEEFLDALAGALREADAGALRETVLDPRAFPGPAVHPSWPQDQLDREYCAPVWAFALEGGCLEIAQRDGRLRLQPALDGLAIERRSSGDRGSWSAYWVEGGRLRVLGDGEGKQPLRLAIADPARAAALWLREGLRRRGVESGEVRAPREGEPSPGVAPLLEHRSAWMLGEAVTACNKESDNFLAEILLRTLGRERGGAGSTAAGVAAVKAVLAEAGAAVDSLAQADGSGMARAPDGSVNRASPAALCSVLRLMASARAAGCGPVFFDSLVIGGVEGRDRSFCGGAEFPPHGVRYKTGWISGASTLCGYLLAPDGRVLVFSIVVNYRPDGTARTNNRRFRELQERMLAETLRAWPKPG